MNMSTDQNMVHWSSLSQSLQTKIDNLKDQSKSNYVKIQFNTKNIDNLKLLLDGMGTKIKEIENKIENDFNRIHNSLDSAKVESNMSDDLRYFIHQSPQGSLARVDKQRITGYEMLTIGLVYTNETDKTTILEYEDTRSKMYEYGITDVALYDIENDKRYMIDEDNELVCTGEIGDWLKNYTFIINPITHKLYFYYYGGKYVDLSSSCDEESGRLYRF